MKADLIIIGSIFNGYEVMPKDTMVAIKNGEFCYVGSKDRLSELQNEHTKILQLKDTMMLPSLCEGHAHVCCGIDLFDGVNLYPLSTPKEYLEAIRSYAEEHPEMDFIIGRGFTNSDFGTVGPTARILDQICPDRNVLLYSEDCHSCWVNSKVLKAAGIDENTEDLPSGVIVRYEGSRLPTGWLMEKEIDRVRPLLPAYTKEKYKEIILKYQEIALAYGIGSTYEPILNHNNDIEVKLQAYQELDEEKKLIMKFRAGITIEPEDNKEEVIAKVIRYRDQCKGPNFMLMGLKVFVDGVIEGHSAYLRKPYADQPEDLGANMWNQMELRTLFALAAKHNITIHVHAIGDGAVDAAIDGFEAASKHQGDRELRNCITHLQIVGEDQFHKLKDLDIIAVTNPFWHYKNPAYYHELELPYLGKERAEKEYPLKSFLDHGIRITQASDWPVTSDFNPFIGLEIAITRREPGNTAMEPLNETEAVTVEEMLKALTINGAYQMKDEELYGSIECGKKANFIVIDRNLFETSKEQLSNTKVLRHFIHGKEVILSH